MLALSCWIALNPMDKKRIVQGFLQMIFISALVFGCSWTSSAGEAGAGTETKVAGVNVRILKGPSTATLTVAALQQFRLRINVDPGTDLHPVTIGIELPETGPKAWPTERVHILDASDRPIPVRRNGIQWHLLEFTTSSTSASYVVCLQEPGEQLPGQKLPTEDERSALDPDTGLAATICTWFDGRQAALSLRFDDSHPTHLSTVIPVLREYGFRGTFMINPGKSDFRERQSEWEACAKLGDQEFANHTLHHRGATSDDEMAQEIGGVSEYIWQLFPQRSKLLALNLGGGTVWMTCKPFSYYLDTYHLFPVTGSLGMDDVYGGRLAAFRRHIERHLERGLWCRTHFHSVGPGLATSDENFRAAMALLCEYEPQVWIAGLADAYKYREERKASKLSLARRNPEEYELQVACLTDSGLYDHPLTIRLTIPEGWEADNVAVVREGRPIPLRSDGSSEPGRHVLLFDADAVDRMYFIRRTHESASKKG